MSMPTQQLTTTHHNVVLRCVEDSGCDAVLFCTTHRVFP